MAHLDLQLPAHAYFFGFAQTDGSLYAGSGQKGRFSIELSVRDEAVLHSFAELFDVRSRVSYRERTTNFGPAHPVCFADYLRGLVDGDGSVGFTRTGRPFISFVAASQPLAEFFCAQALAVTGAQRTSRRNSRDGVYNPMVAGDPAAPFAAWLYPDGCLALDRKRESAERVAAWTRPVDMRARPVLGARRWTAAEDADVFTGSVREAASRLGRSEKAVNIRRCRLRHMDLGHERVLRVDE